MSRLRVFFILFLSLLFLFGCTSNLGSLLKKKCESSACMKQAFLNNCEEAYLDENALGMNAKSDVTKEGNRCKVTEEVYGSSGNRITKVVCYYDMPVGSNMLGDCTRS